MSQTIGDVIEAYLAAPPYFGRSERRDKEALKGPVGGQWDNEHRMWFARNTTVLLRMMDTGKWHPAVAASNEAIIAHLEAKAAARREAAALAASEAAAKAAEKAARNPAAQRQQKKLAGTNAAMMARMFLPGGVLPSTPTAEAAEAAPSTAPPSSSGSVGKRRYDHVDGDRDDDGGGTQGYAPNFALTADEIARLEASKGQPPLWTPSMSTYCRKCRLYIHDQFLDCHCTFATGLVWTRCDVPGCHRHRRIEEGALQQCECGDEARMRPAPAVTRVSSMISITSVPSATSLASA